MGALGQRIGARTVLYCVLASTGAGALTAQAWAQPAGPGDDGLASVTTNSSASDASGGTLAGSEASLAPLQPAAALAGRVVDGDGRPVAGARVEVKAAREPWSSEARSRWLTEDRDVRTGPDGRFIADALPTGIRLGLVARAPGFAAGLRALPPLAAGERRSGIEVVLAPGRRAFGRVLDPAGRPVAGAVVAARRHHPAAADPSWWCCLVESATETDAEGRFDLTGLGSGSAELWISAARHRGALTTAVRIDVGTNPATDLGDLRLAPGYRVAGRVVDEDGVPVPGVEVEIRGLGNRCPGGGFEVEHATSDADGAFAFQGRAAGEHELTAARDQPPSRGSARALPPEDRDVPLVLRPGVRLSGRITDSEGGPIASAQVESWMERSSSQPVRATTDGQGRFTLAGLRAGQHRIEVEAAGYLDSTLQVLIADGVDPGPVDFELLAGTTVTGTVRWPDGRPAAGVRVFAQGVDGADWISPSGTTGPAGFFSFGPVPPGPARLVAHKGSLRAKRRIEAGPETSAETLTLPPGSQISGLVVDPSGKPVGAAQVWLASREAGGAWTGADGRFVLPDVPSGRYPLVVDHPAYARYRSNEWLEVADALIDDLRVELHRGAVVIGRVEGIRSGIGSRARVSLDRKDGAERSSSHLDAEGRFRIERVSPGEYEAEAWDGEVIATGGFTLAPGTESLEIELEPVAGTDLRGRVVRGGRGVANVRVAARTEARTVEDRTSAEGRFVLRRVPAGVRELEVDDPGGHTHRREIGRVEATADGELRVELPAGGISGRVTDAGSGTPLARVKVFLESLTGSADDPTKSGWQRRIERQAWTDSRGAFVLYAVDPGRYRVRSEDADPDLGPRVGLRETEVASEPVHGVDLALGPGHWVVLRPTPPPDPRRGLGLPYALYDPEGRLERTGVAAHASGRVILEDVPEGEWRLWIGDYTTILQGIDVRVPSDEEIPMELVEGGTIRFELPEELVDPRSVDLEVVLRDARGRQPPGPPGKPIRPSLGFWGGFDEPEQAQVGHLPPGRWTIELRHADGRVWRGEFTVAAGRSAHVVLE